MKWRYPFWLALLGCFALAPRAVFAHAALLVSEPADGAQLRQPPSDIVLRFDEPVTPLSLRLHGATGIPLGLPAPGEVLRIRLPAGIDAGGLVLSWRVVSTDGHPVGGAVAFTIGEVAIPVQHGGAHAGVSYWALLLTTLRIAFLICITVSCGGALFRVLITAPSLGMHRTVRISAIAAAVIAVVAIGAAGAWFAEASVADLLNASVWVRGAHTPFAASMAVSVLGCAICAVAIGGTVVWRRAAMLVGACLGAFGFTLAGHAATAHPRWLSTIALALHVFGASFWLGSLWPLCGLLLARGANSSREIACFSRRAMVLVPVLILAGLILALLRLPHVHALFASTYGGVLLAKVALVSSMLTLAIWNRQRLTPALAAGKSGAVRKLALSIQAELALGLVVLGLTAILARTAPPTRGTGADETQRGITIETQVGDQSATVAVSPGLPGINSVSIRAARCEHREAWLELEQPLRGIGPIRRPLQDLGNGQLRYRGPELIVSGLWRFRLECLVSDFERITGAGYIDLPDLPVTARPDHRHDALH